MGGGGRGSVASYLLGVNRALAAAREQLEEARGQLWLESRREMAAQTGRAVAQWEQVQGLKTYGKVHSPGLGSGSNMGPGTQKGGEGRPPVCLASPAPGQCRAQKQGWMVEDLVQRKYHEFTL